MSDTDRVDTLRDLTKEKTFTKTEFRQAIMANTKSRQDLIEKRERLKDSEGFLVPEFIADLKSLPDTTVDVEKMIKEFNRCAYKDKKGSYIIPLHIVMEIVATFLTPQVKDEN